jgi:two-component system repressor protein LuxO
MPVATPNDGPAAADGIDPLETVIRSAIERAIALCDGNIPRAANALKVSPSTLYRRIQMWSQEGDGPQDRSTG